MDYKEFKVGTKYIIDESKFEVVKKTRHFTTFKWTYRSGGKFYESTFRRKERFDFKENGFFEPSTPTMSVNVHHFILYACEFE